MTTRIPNIPRPNRRNGARLHTAVRLDPQLRQLRVEVARWALANGRPLNLDAITVILAARRAEAEVERRPFNRWSTTSLLTFLFGSCTDWCRAAGVALPPSRGEALLTYLDFLNAHEALAIGSSPIGQLRRTVAHLCSLNAAGYQSDGSTTAGPVVPTPIAVGHGPSSERPLRRN